MDQACSAGSRSRSGRAYSGYQPSASQPDMVIACGQEVSGVRGGLQPVGMFRVVASPGGAAFGFQGRISTPLEAR